LELSVRLAYTLPGLKPLNETRYDICTVKSATFSKVALNDIMASGSDYISLVLKNIGVFQNRYRKWYPMS
jgi:hypothetical protein